MEMYEVRYTSKRSPSANEISHIICTTLAKAKEIAKRAAAQGIWKRVWVCPMCIENECLIYDNGKNMIIIKDENYD